MNRKNKTQIFKVKVLVLAVLVLFLLSCTKKLVEVQIDSVEVSQQLLIAGDYSEFKNLVRKKIIEYFKKEFMIKVVNISRLNDIDAGDYSVILIMDTCLAWSAFNPTLKKFLSEPENIEKTVLFITAGDPDWEFAHNDVDAITSASNVENEELVFERIKSEMLNVINNNRE